MIQGLLAVCGGVLGSLLGGTASFVCAGTVGLISSALSLCGVRVLWFEDLLRGVLFFPGVIFNGGAAASACAGRRHRDYSGLRTDTGLLFLRDPAVIAVGGAAGLLGHLIHTALLPYDTVVDGGAVAVVAVNLLARLIFAGPRMISPHPTEEWRSFCRERLARETVLAAAVSLAAAAAVHTTGLLSLPFYCSAFSLLFSFFIPGFPCTHQITMVAAYAVFYTGSFFLAAVLGIVSHLLFWFFQIFCNTDLNAHVDPPAAAILAVSTVLFALLPR